MLRLGRLALLQKQSWDKTCTRFQSNSKSANKLKKSKKRDKPSSEERITNREINLFYPQDSRTPLPGNVGLVAPLQDDPRMVVNKKTIAIKGLHDDDGIVRHLKETLNEANREEEDDQPRNATLDIIVHKCPQLIGNDIQEMFPYKVFDRELTLVTFSRKNFNLSPSNENPGNEINVEDLSVQDFVQLAKVIRRKLWKAGYWADFISPNVDWSQVRKSNNSTLLEVAVRYHQLGFTIKNTGKCQVILHHRWGTEPYVGSLLTNASHNSPELTTILDLFKN